MYPEVLIVQHGGQPDDANRTITKDRTASQAVAAGRVSRFKRRFPRATLEAREPAALLALGPVRPRPLNDFARHRPRQRGAGHDVAAVVDSSPSGDFAASAASAASASASPGNR